MWSPGILCGILGGAGCALGGWGPVACGSGEGCGSSQEAAESTAATPIPAEARSAGAETESDSERVSVPAGTYHVGSGMAREAPRWRVELAAFDIDRYPVSVAEYWPYIARGHSEGLKEFAISGIDREDAGRTPLTLVNAHEAEAFCAWRGGRLPTEPEWEAAARGEDTRLFPWGSEWGRGHVAQRGFYKVFTREHPTGASPWGVEDLVGNVFHLTGTRIPATVRDQPEWDEPWLHVVKGGAVSRIPAFNRVPFRTAVDAGHRASLLGFRCVYPHDPEADPNARYTTGNLPFGPIYYTDTQALRQILSNLLHPARRLPPLWEQTITALPRGARVADIGCGVGFLTRILARRVGPTGRVYAVDIDESVLEFVEQAVVSEGLSWIETVCSRSDHVGLPAGELDGLFLFGTLHHVEEGDLQAFLESCAEALAPRGTLVVADTERYPNTVTALAMLEAMGFTLESREDYDYAACSEPLALAWRELGPVPRDAEIQDFSAVYRRPVGR